MKNYIIAGAFLVLLASASLLLPSSLMKWQDRQRTGKSETVEVQEVVLKEQVSMTLSEKLKLQGQELATALEMVNGKNYNQDTIGEQVRKEIGILAEQEILIDFDTEQPVMVADTSVYFYVDMEDSERSTMVWRGYVQTSEYRVDFSLDDETGKILSFTQWAYETATDHMESGAITDTGVVSSTGKGDVVVANRSFYIGKDEIEELSERWSEYLGCTMADYRLTWMGLLTDAEKELYVSQVENLISKGYNQAEAESRAALGWGLDPQDKKPTATLEDEGGQVLYIFWPEKETMFSVEPVFL